MLKIEKTFKCTLFLFLFGVLLSACSNAWAVPIDLTFLGVEPNTGVKVHMPDGTTPTYLAGNYKVEIDAAGNIFDGTYFSFCVDPAYAPPLNTPKPYELVGIAPGSDYEYAAWIMDYSLTHSSVSRVAAQLAVWEIMFDSNWNTSDDLAVLNDFYVMNNTYRPLSQTLVDLAHNADLSLFDETKYAVAISPPGAPKTFGVNYQDYLIASPAPVPEPGTMLLLGSGLLGLGVFRRKLKA